MSTFSRALFDFGVARIACRKEVFREATAVHEPARLINSRIWGSGLFPPEEVTKVRRAAERANESLLSRWGLPPHLREKEGQDVPKVPAPKKQKVARLGRDPATSVSKTPRPDRTDRAFPREAEPSKVSRQVWRKNEGRGVKSSQRIPPSDARSPLVPRGVYRVSREEEGRSRTLAQDHQGAP